MTKRHVTETIVSLIIGLTLFFVITGVNGVYGGKLSGVEVARFLCDGFFVSGVVLLGFAALYWASDKGAFDGLKYSFTSFFRLHFSTHRYDWKEKESFQEYKERIHSDEKKKKNVSITAIIGGVFMIGAIICLIIYETI